MDMFGVAFTWSLKQLSLTPSSVAFARAAAVSAPASGGTLTQLARSLVWP